METDDQLFKIPLNLEHLSVINLAIHCWKYEDVKCQLEKFILGLKSPNLVGNKYEEWAEVTSYAIKYVKNLNPPEKLGKKIKNMIMMIGEKIAYWYQHVYFYLGFDIKYAKDIYWTSYGRINEVQIFKVFWQTDLEFSVSKCTCFFKKPLYCMACMYVDINFIHNNFRSMKNVISSILPASRRDGINTEYGLIAIWLCFCISGNQQKGLEVFRSFKKSADEIPAVELFQMCASSGFKFATKYFWNKLSTDEKQIYVAKVAKEGLNNCMGITMFHDQFGDLHKKENIIEILLFLINQMSLLQLSEFLTKHFFSFFHYLIQNWPYQELCRNFVDKMWDQLVDSPRFDSFDVMLTIHDYLVKDYRIKSYTNKTIYHSVFQIVLEKSPLDVKESFFIEGINDRPSLEYMYENFDPVGLSLLINDADLKSKHKDHMLDVGVGFFKKLVLKGKYKKLNEFINHVFMSPEEQKHFKERFNFVPTFLILGQFELADKNLKWLSDSECERIAFKKQINSAKICSMLIGAQPKSVDKFLSWRFDTDEERETIKKVLIANESVRNQIFKIWGKIFEEFEVNEAEEKCMELLNWFFKSEEEISDFRKTKLIKNELFYKKIWDNLYYKGSFEFLDEFLKFCLVSPEEIKRMKEKVADNIVWWIDTFALEGDYFLMVDALLCWVFKDKKAKKRNVIKRYMESLPGALLCVRMLKKAPHTPWTPVLHLFNGWIGHLEVNISVIERHLSNFNENFLAEETLLVVKKFLKNAERCCVSHHMLNEWEKLYGSDSSSSDL